MAHPRPWFRLRTTLEERYTHTDYCRIGGFCSWTAATVPISVVCLRDHYADGHHKDWALMSSYLPREPMRLLDYYRKRTTIEKRHRQLNASTIRTTFFPAVSTPLPLRVVMVLLTYTLAPMAALEISGGSFGQFDSRPTWPKGSD